MMDSYLLYVCAVGNDRLVLSICAVLNVGLVLSLCVACYDGLMFSVCAVCNDRLVPWEPQSLLIHSCPTLGEYLTHTANEFYVGVSIPTPICRPSATVTLHGIDLYMFSLTWVRICLETIYFFRPVPLCWEWDTKQTLFARSRCSEHRRNSP
jgi:hypothetical protein